MDEQPQIVDSSNARPLPSIAGHVRFEHVRFKYATGPEVLHGLDLDVPPGTTVALVGHTGAGKSTIAKLLARFYDPVEGRITIDGVDLRDLRLRDLRDQFAVVTQDTYIFNDTLRANLLLACPQASEAEIEAAVEMAQLTEFVRQLPQGLKTRVGEQGLRLSGGERQRLAIARAFLKNAPILIFDEVTANLDPLIERALLDTLHDLARGHTTLHITHRLLDMELMDEILVVQRGRIVERGTHDELLALGGLYRQLFDVQEGVLTFPAR
jgi:ABC-type multidrug transport system fused ATPase/permease subunit